VPTIKTQYQGRRKMKEIALQKGKGREKTGLKKEQTKQGIEEVNDTPF